MGSLTLVDGDVVDASNANRQLPAMSSTVGRPKVQVMAERLRDIAPGSLILPKEVFVLPETATELVAAGAPSALEPDAPPQPYHWVIDAVDSIAPKCHVIAAACRAGTRVISSMGAGGRMDAARPRVIPLSHTFNDPFASNVRKSLRRLGVDLKQVGCLKVILRKYIQFDVAYRTSHRTF